MSYCILFHPVWLSSLGDLLFSEEERRDSTSGREGRWRGAGRSGGGGNCSRNVCMREESVFNKNKKTKPNINKHTKKTVECCQRKDTRNLCGGE